MIRDDIVKKSEKIHNFYYEYSKVVDSRMKDKITIICNKHGIFTQQLYAHLNGSGCKKCVNDILRKNRQKSIEQFIIDSKLFHNNKYDYSLVEYINNHTKIKIICPIHGVFEQMPIKHLRSGCKKCANDTLRIERQKSKAQFELDAKLVHNNKYDYSLVKYINNQTNVKIICTIHGEFEQIPKNHLNGAGCFKCGHENRPSLDQEVFIDKCNIIHNNLYGYSLVNYKTSHVKIKILCNIHGEFSQTPNSHRNGAGCPYCANIKNRLRYIQTLKDRFDQNIQITPNFNISACKLFDNIMIKDNIYIQHAMNGGKQLRIKN